MNNTKIFGFRKDLRISDNPALTEASKAGNILPIYINDIENSKDHAMGSASKCWLHYSLDSLDESLKNKLSFYIGNPLKIILELIDEYNINQIYWNFQ